MPTYKTRQVVDRHIIFVEKMAYFFKNARRNLQSEVLA